MIANDLNIASNISFEDVQNVDTGGNPNTEEELTL